MRLGESGVAVLESKKGEEEDVLCPICLDPMELDRLVRILPGYNCVEGSLFRSTASVCWIRPDLVRDSVLLGCDPAARSASLRATSSSMWAPATAILSTSHV
jgi:hypothetical protein